MKLSIFTTITNPYKRGDPIDQAIECYLELADEVVVVNGGYEHIEFNPKLKIIESDWPTEFDWPFIGQQFQRGYEACTGDWVIRADIDCIFHENDLDNIRKALEAHNKKAALSFWKYQFINPGKYNVKSRLVLAINKANYGNRIRFDGGGDLCQATLDGQYLTPSDVMESRVAIYNYECLLKTKGQLLEDKGRFARAWQKHFGEYKLGGPDDVSAYSKWLTMVKGRYMKPQAIMKFEDHPKYIKETIKNLNPEQWGFNGFGFLKEKTC